MKKNYFNRALLIFEAFKTRQITAEDFDVAEQKKDKLTDRSSDFKLLIDMGRDVFQGRYKMSKWNMTVIVATILYVISPLDAIPDVIPVLGWLDDVTIIGYAISKLTAEIAAYRSFKGSLTRHSTDA